MSYKEFITDTIKEFKNNYHTYPTKYQVPLIENGTVIGRLRPIPTIFENDSEKDIYYQTKWRNLHKDSFLVDPFVATEERTLSWLKKIYFENHECIIFMIEDIDNKPIGHLAFENFVFDEFKCEYGRLIRGEISIYEKRNKINLIEIAQIAFLNWGFNFLKLRSVYGTQFTDNYPVTKLHEKCGFKKVNESSYLKQNKEIKISEVELKIKDFKFYNK